jgi:hypothetical protein
MGQISGPIGVQFKVNLSKLSLGNNINHQEEAEAEHALSKSIVGRGVKKKKKKNRVPTGNQVPASSFDFWHPVISR